jgi:hypothetical protein
LQRMIEPKFKGGAFFEAQVVITEQSCDCANPGASARAYTSAFASAFHRACGCPDARTYSDGFDFMLRAHALALQFAFFAGLFDRVVTGNPSDGGDQRHVAVAGIDLIKAEHHACVQALFNGADVPLDSFAPWDDSAVSGYEIFGELRFEVLSGLQLAGVEPVVETDEKACAFGDRVGRSLRRNGWILSKYGKTGEKGQDTPQRAGPKAGHSGPQFKDSACFRVGCSAGGKGCLLVGLRYQVSARYG